MHSSCTSDANTAVLGSGPGCVLHHPAAATQHYCHLCAHDGPSPTNGAPVPEGRYGPRSRAFPEDEEGGAVLEGPRARRPFPSLMRRGSGEEEIERNGGGGGSGHVMPRNMQRKVDFYLGPNHCAVLEECTPRFPQEWDPCYVSPPRWNWPAVEPCWEHCACSRDARSERERTPPLPPLPSPPCCYSPERRPLSASHAPHHHPPEFMGHPRRREVVHSGMKEPCWECVRAHYWRDRHRPDLIAVDPVCGYNGQYQQALSPVLSYGHERTYVHQRLSRQTSPEHGPCNGPTMGQRTFFPTEVPLAKLRGSEKSGFCRPKSVHGLRKREPESVGQKEKESKSGAVNQQKSQGSVREQIRRVMGDLEEVLGGLKQVHLEMKEVVQQIDVMTSNIDLGGDESSSRTSHEPLLQQQALCHEVKALVHMPANTPPLEEPQQQQQPQGINGSPTPKLSTCHPSITWRGHNPTIDSHRVKALISGHEATKNRSKMNGNCVAPRPPRDRVKDAQRRRLELASLPSSLPANGSTTSVKNHKPQSYPNHNGQLELLHKDFDASVSVVRTAAHQGKGGQLSTVV